MKHAHLVWKHLETLTKNRDDVIEFISQFPEEEIRKVPSEGWSAMQALRHIQIAESLSLAYLKKKILAGDELKERTFKPRIYLKLVAVAFRIGLKFKAPAVLKDPQDTSLNELLSDWDETRQELGILLEKFPDNLEMKAVYRHPFAGMLNITDAVRFLNIHQNHHIRQVHRIAMHL